MDFPSDPATGEPGSGVLVRPRRRAKRAAKRAKPRRVPRWNVVLWDSDDHTFSYVVQMLRELFGHPPEKGYLLAVEVDASGKAVVLTTTREHAELKRDQVISHGRDPRCSTSAGSMSATIEPCSDAD